MAWPHDGLQHDKGSGIPLRDIYKQHGVHMLHERATFDGGGSGVEAGVMEMLDRMESMRFRVFEHLAEWLEEFRIYHRKDGRIVKEHDDLMSATRYAVMMLRHARVHRSHLKRRGPVMAEGVDYDMFNPTGEGQRRRREIRDAEIYGVG